MKPMKPWRILLADDHDIVREGLKVIVNAEPDIEVVGEARDGTEALERTVSLTPDVVVMDISMPRLNGLQALAAIRRSCPQTKVLVLTRHAADGYLQQVLNAGGLGYVRKQSRPGELLEGIRAVAAGGQYLDRHVTAYVLEERRRASQATRAPLTAREEEVLHLVAAGYSNKEAAARLGLSVKTVETHKANAMTRLGLRSRAELVEYAHLHGWFDEDL